MMKRSTRTMLGLFAVLLLMGGLFGLAKVMGWKKEGFESTTVQVTFYFLPGCGWCEKFEPEWEKFEKLAKEKGILTRKVNAKEETDEVQQKGITGFPTVIITKNGKETDYQGDRTAEDLLKAAGAA